MRDMDERLLDERHQALMLGLKSIHERLDKLNGRTRDSEREIAVLADRSGRSNAISIGALSAVVAAAVYWVM